MLETVALYLLLGACAGTLAGLFGIGGGLIIVPVLIISLSWQGVDGAISTHLAVGTSLATVVFTSLSSIRTHHAMGAVRWDIFRPMVVGIVLGAALGAMTAGFLSGPWLQRIIGGFVLLVSLQMGLQWRPSAARPLPGSGGLSLAGGGIGWASAIFGIGGGTLTVPLLSWCGVRAQQAVATSAACGLPIALSGAATNMVVGWQRPLLPDYSLGFVYLPALLGIVITSVPFAVLGARLAHRLPERLLKRLFALLLLVLGVRFLLLA
ncbi:MAG: sulfite exporter TauE/SafE family protein [Oleiphilaceae bacterium]|nr:sulfite exporter TauE/SafE family protein [Oleiphilaceae bacterium]